MRVPVRPDVSQSPTDHQPGGDARWACILGTAAYMSPEQARGQGRRQAGRHLGVRLRALRDARRARARFAGDDVSRDAGAMCSKCEPDWTALPSEHTGGAPQTCCGAAWRRIAGSALRDIGDARLAMDEALEHRGCGGRHCCRRPSASRLAAAAAARDRHRHVDRRDGLRRLGAHASRAAACGSLDGDPVRRNRPRHRWLQYRGDFA